MRFLASLLILPACQNVSTAPAIAEMEKEHAPVRESWGVRTYLTQIPTGEAESRRRVEFAADHVAWYETEDEAYQLLKSVTSPVTVYLYDAAGDTSATVTAREVRYFDTQYRIEASGDVVVHSRDGTRITTESLEWRGQGLSLLHISPPPRRAPISYAVFFF